MPETEGPASAGPSLLSPVHPSGQAPPESPNTGTKVPGVTGTPGVVSHDPREVAADEVTAVFDRMAGRRPAKAPGKPSRQPIDRIADLESVVADLDHGNPLGRIARLEEGLAALTARVARIGAKAPDDPTPTDPLDDPPASSDPPGPPVDRGGGAPKTHT